MPSYESNQTMLNFMRRLQGNFSGFSVQTVPFSEGMTQMFLGEMLYKENRLSIAMFTRPSDRKDCVVVSRPMFHVPEASREDLFSQLLAFNNGATESVHFAVDEPLNTINIVCFRTMDGLTFPEFQYCLNNIINVARNCVAPLISEYGLLRLP